MNYATGLAAAFLTQFPPHVATFTLFESTIIGGKIQSFVPITANFHLLEDIHYLSRQILITSFVIFSKKIIYIGSATVFNSLINDTKTNFPYFFAAVSCDLVARHWNHSHTRTYVATFSWVLVRSLFQRDRLGYGFFWFPDEDNKTPDHSNRIACHQALDHSPKNIVTQNER